MGLHPLQNIVQRLYCSEDVWAFVEHNGLRTMSHGGVGDFGTRRHSLLGESFKYLSCPNDGAMGGLANPENLLLDFGHPLKSAFDSEVAPRNHYAKAGTLHTCKQHGWEL